MLFKVRIKNSKCVLEVYSIVFDEENLRFLAYDGAEQKWIDILADNCIPA